MLSLPSPAMATDYLRPTVYGNLYDKYSATNLLHKYLVSRFLQSATRLVRYASPGTVLDVGCADGQLGDILATRAMCANVAYTGIDISDEHLQRARMLYRHRRYVLASADALPQGDKYDLVICCEVLEHICNPMLALAEMRRVCSGYLLLSVPLEPHWRVLNCLRLKYLRTYGNTPGHLQHYSRSAIRCAVKQHYDIVATASPFPWTMLLAKPRASTHGTD